MEILKNGNSEVRSIFPFNIAPLLLWLYFLELNLFKETSSFLYRLSKPLISLSLFVDDDIGDGGGGGDDVNDSNDEEMLVVD